MFGSGPAPPVNNALLPDIYNRLDAGAIEKTRVVNNQLRVRLESQEKVILKYKKQAIRTNVVEQSKVTNDLSRISKKLPTVKKVHDFDAKFFKSRRSHSDPMPRIQKRKGYLEDKNEDAICHRCYIHHLPLKKKYYHVTPIQSPMVLEGASQPSPTGKRRLPLAPILPSQQPIDVVPEVPRSNEIDENENPYPQSPTVANRKAGSRLIPVSCKFQFLERDRYGHERDLNACLTPRLMPNEDWKFVVKNVCSQHRRAPKLPKNDERKAIEDSNANRSRRPSLRTGSKSRGEPRPASRSTSLLSRHSTRTEIASGKQKSNTNGEVADTQRARRHSCDNSRSGKRTGKPSSGKQTRPAASDNVDEVSENSGGDRTDDNGAKTKRSARTPGKSRRSSSSQPPPLNRRLSGMTPPKEHEDGQE